MAADPKVKVGRAATPPPPNIGSSSLGNILQLRLDPRFTHHRHVLCLSSPGTRRLIAAAGFNVFPAIPGLANEALSLLSLTALVIEEESLSSGVWSGAGSDFAPELRAELDQVLAEAQNKKIAIYWLRRHKTEPPIYSTEEDDEGSEMAGLPDLVCPGGVLIAPGSKMFNGTEEGARSSRLVECLATAVGRP